MGKQEPDPDIPTTDDAVLEAVEDESHGGNALNGENSGVEQPTPAEHKKSRKQRREEKEFMSRMLDTDLKFKTVDFSIALTKEERAEKRKARKETHAARARAKKGLSPKKERKKKPAVPLEPLEVDPLAIAADMAIAASKTGLVEVTQSNVKFEETSVTDTKKKTAKKTGKGTKAQKGDKIQKVTTKENKGKKELGADSSGKNKKAKAKGKGKKNDKGKIKSGDSVESLVATESVIDRLRRTASQLLESKMLLQQMNDDGDEMSSNKLDDDASSKRGKRRPSRKDLIKKKKSEISAAGSIRHLEEGSVLNRPRRRKSAHSVRQMSMDLSEKRRRSSIGSRGQLENVPVDDDEDEDEDYDDDEMQVMDLDDSTIDSDSEASGIKKILKKKKKSAKAKKTVRISKKVQEEVLPEVALSMSEEMLQMKQRMLAEMEAEQLAAEIAAAKKAAKEAKKAAKAETAKAKQKVSKKGSTKDKGKKPMTKEQRIKAMEKAEAERLRIEAEEAAAAEEVRRILAAEKNMAMENERREYAEHLIREEQLQNAARFQQYLREKKLEHDSQVKLQEEWETYLKCDGLPDPTNCAVMNTYLHLWEEEMPKVDILEAERKTNEVLKILETMDYIIEAPYQDDLHKVENWKWVRSLVRNHQTDNLNAATYHALRNIDLKLRRLNIPTADYRMESEQFALVLWLLMQLPIPMFNPRTPLPPRIDLEFPEMGMKVFFPASLECQKMAIRAMYMKYDHLSDTCASFATPETPPDLDQDLLACTHREYRDKMMYRYVNRSPSKTPNVITLEDGTTVVEEAQIFDLPESAFGPNQIPPPVPYQHLEPSPSEHALQCDEQLYAAARALLEPPERAPEDVLNLRQYVVLGGTFELDLYYQPPQPQGMVWLEMVITALIRPKSLRDVPFFVQYVPPPPPEPGVIRLPEEIETEIKAQEAEYDNLILVTLDMPQHVIWLDVPIVCHWDSEMNAWRTKNVHDVKHIEEKNYVTFRTGIFGIFALATNKYASLPYQTWELKPEVNGTVTLQLTTAQLMVEFNVQGSLVSVAQLQGSPNKALQEIVGVYYKFAKLKMIMMKGGVDIFPAQDAFCYVKMGTCEKHWAMERQFYCTMAQISQVFNFAWSRWNVTAGRRTLVCQMREYKPEKLRQPSYQMLMVSPLRAMLVDCTEVSQTFDETPTEDMKFYSELFYLVKGITTVATRTKIGTAPPDLISTLSELLTEIRMMSFS